MNRPSVAVCLKRQNAWPFKIVRILLNSHGCRNPREDLLEEKAFGSELAVCVQ
jgi:hypothetical protein